MGSTSGTRRDSTSACPSSGVLRAYLVDASSSSQAAALETHIGSCAACLRRLEHFAADDDLERCKASRRRMEQDSSRAVIPSAATEDFVPVGEGPQNEERHDAAPTAPQTLGRYRLERFLGRGGFGVVYLAADTLLDRQVALKLATASTALDPTLRQRFVAEARIAAQLRHRHIVPVYEAGEIDGHCFFASEYIPGPTLAERLADGDPLSFTEAARLVAGIADAVQHAHEQGIVHRDIKPGNILLDARETAREERHVGLVAAVAKLADFGLAKAMDAGGDLRTQTGMLLGTPSYMAPEQARAGQCAASPATDVYALGATLYEALVGRPPASGASVIETLQRVATETPVSPHLVRADVPRDLEAICLKCLEKEPTRRYATAAALAEDLRRFLTGQPTLARPATAVESVWKLLRRHPRAAGSAAAVAAALLAFIAMLTTLNVRLEGALERAESNRAYAQQLLYASDVRLASAALRDGDLAQFAELMGRHLPSSSSRDLRGFEWHALVRRTGVDQQVLQQSGPPLYCVRQSPAGDLLAAAGADDGVRVWDVATGKLQRTIPTGQGEVNSVCFSPDGKALATAGDDGSVVLWDLATGDLRLRIAAHDAIAYGVAFVRQGTAVASCGNEPTVRLWDAASGASVGVLEGHTQAVEAIAACARGEVLASASGDASAIVWDLDSRRPRRHLHGHVDRVNCLALSRDGALLVTGGQDRTLRQWDVATGVGEPIGQHHDAILAVALLPGERQAAVCDRGGLTRVHTLKVQERSAMRPVSGAAAFDRLTRGWADDTAHGSKSWNQGPHRVLWWEVTPDDRQLLVVTSAGALVRELSTGNVTDLPLHSASLVTDLQQASRARDDRSIPVDLAADGSTWLCGNELYQADATSQTGWRFMHKLDEAADRLAAATLAPDGSAVALARSDGTLVLWNRDVAQQWRPRRLTGPGTPWRALQFAPDGRRLAAADDAAHVQLWDVASGETVLRVPSAGAPVTALAFLSPESLIGGDQTGRLCEWELPTGTLKRSRAAHIGPIQCLSVTPDGLQLATQAAQPDDTRVLWDLATWKRLATLSHNIQPQVFPHIAFYASAWRTRKEPIYLVSEPTGVKACRSPLVDGAALTQQASYRAHQGRAYSCVALDDASIVTVGKDGRVVRARFGADAARSLLNYSTLDFAPTDGSRVAVVTADHATLEIDAVDGRIVRTLLAPPERMQSVGYCSNANAIVAVTESGRWRTWNDDGQLRETPLRGEARRLEHCSPSGQRLAFTAYDTKRIAIVRSDNRRLVRAFDNEVRGKLAVLAPDDRTLYADWQDAVIAWDLESGQKRHVLQGHRDGVHAVVVSDDGSKVATGGGERGVVLWDAETGKPLRRFVGHRARVTAICFAPDGRSLATGDRLGAIKVWQIASGRELLQLDDRRKEIVKMAFTSDGTRLVVHTRGFDLISYNASPASFSAFAYEASANASP